MSVAILKYNAGNVASVQNALTRLGYESIVTDDAEEIMKADKVIFPGVGEASSAMEYLRVNKLDVVLKNLNQPVLGICLGMQLLCDYSEEGNTKCLGIFETAVKKFPHLDIVPQMGWNNLSNTKGDLFKGITDIEDVYFVHSYYADLCENTFATCNYILPFSASLQKDNFYATQFHPEKSGAVGEKILMNFLKL